jgi:hypothetical protein
MVTPTNTYTTQHTLTFSQSGGAARPSEWVEGLGMLPTCMREESGHQEKAAMSGSFTFETPTAENVFS